MPPRECQCAQPEPKLNKPNVCVKCGASLDTDWACNDKTLCKFMDELADCIPASDRHIFGEFRLHVEAREAAGRSTFRQSFLSKPMGKNAREEFADGAMYVFMRALQRIRAGQEQNLDVIHDIAVHAFMAWRGTLILAERERGVSSGFIGDNSVHDIEQPAAA